MNIVSLFISHTQALLIKQPIKGRLDNVAISAQSATMFGIAFGDQGLDTARTQRLADFVFGVIGTIRECFVRASAWAATRLFDRRYRIDQSNGPRTYELNMSPELNRVAKPCKTNPSWKSSQR